MCAREGAIFNAYHTTPDFSRRRILIVAVVAFVALALLGPAAARAADDSRAAGAGADATATETGGLYIPDVSGLLPQARSKESLSASLQILVMLTLLTVAPSILLMMTSFVRMLIVLVLLRQALGTQQVPPSQILVGLALFMTFLAMAPTFDAMRRDAFQPYMDGKLEQTDALAAAGGHLRNFMFDQIEAAENEDDVYMLYEYATRQPLAEGQTITREQVPLSALVPAFMLSELKTAFVIGFRIYIPFLVIDMVIATVLVSMGMMMLPPVLISLPFKLLLFVLSDGWRLIAGALMAGVV